MSLLCPAAERRGQAQYLFEPQVYDVIKKMMMACKMHKVVSMCTPSIHFDIQNTVSEPSTPVHSGGGPSSSPPCADTSPDFSSVLFDIDARLAQFCHRGQFVHFNIFNQHFFAREQAARGLGWLTGADIVLFDPPFGVHPELLGATLKWLRNVTRAHIVLFMPYFNEVCSCAARCQL